MLELAIAHVKIQTRKPVPYQWAEPCLRVWAMLHKLISRCWAEDLFHGANRRSLSSSQKMLIFAVSCVCIIFYSWIVLEGAPPQSYAIYLLLVDGVIYRMAIYLILFGPVVCDLLTSSYASHHWLCTKMVCSICISMQKGLDDVDTKGQASHWQTKGVHGKQRANPNPLCS